MNENDIHDFLNDYNNLLSKAGEEYKGNFAALACPTLNKQETITFLYRDINTFIHSPKAGLKPKNECWLFLMLIVRLGYRLINLSVNSIRFRISSLPEKCIYIRTWLVPRSIKNGVVCDDYFKSLVDDLKKDHDVIVAFQPLEYGKLIDRFYKAKKQDNFIVPIGLLSIIDIIALLYKYLTTAKIQLQKQYLFKGRDVSHLINNSLKRDYYHCQSFQAYLDLFISKKIHKYKPQIILYVFENQAWENAYILEFQGSETKLIGYQSSGFSTRFLNFFPSKLDSINAFFPDKILTVGDLYTELLKTYGNYPIPIETFAALRFDYPIEDGQFIVRNPIETVFKRILYAFPVHFYQYSAIIDDLIQVFGNSEIEVHLKFHPLYINQLDGKTLPDNFFIWKPDHSKSLREVYDLVLFNDNSFGIESLIEGVKSYEYLFGELYPETRMNYFDCYNSILLKENLFLLKDELVSGKFEKKLNVLEISRYINKNYKPYNNSLIPIIIDK